MDLAEQQQEFIARALKVRARLLSIAKGDETIPLDLPLSPFITAFISVHKTMGDGCQFLTRIAVKICQEEPDLAKYLLILPTS